MGNVRRAKRGNNDALSAKVDDTMGTPATLSNDAVQRVIRQNLAGVRACFLRIGRDGDQRSGKAIVSFEIGAGGDVHEHEGRRARVPGDVAARLRAGDGVALGVPEVAEGWPGDQLPVRVRRRVAAWRRCAGSSLPLATWPSRHGRVRWRSAHAAPDGAGPASPAGATAERRERQAGRGPTGGAGGGGRDDRRRGHDGRLGRRAVGGRGAASCIGTKPTATNTGVPAGFVLTPVNGDMTVTQDGTTIDGKDINGFLIIAASNVRVTRSIVRGHATPYTQNTGVIRINSGTNILIEDVEVAVAAPSATVDGMWGDHFVGRRLNIHGGVDGLKAGSNTTLECSYIHDQAYFASDPNQGGGPTHNDAIQILEGTGIHIAGNQLVAAKDQNAAIQITQDFGAVGDLHIESNWADGGGCTFNISHKGAASLAGVHVIGNRFGRNSFFDCPILKSTQTTLELSGNVWDDDGTTVPSRRTIDVAALGAR